jgi:hypothetical protein
LYIHEKKVTKLKEVGYMPRKTIVKISESKFKDYIINRLVDENGKRISIRELIIDKDFIKYTGLKPSKCATVGTISYHLKKLKITERSLYDYHIKSGRIPVNLPFEKFQLNKTEKQCALKKLAKVDTN